jgi:predicted ATPase
MEKLSIKNFAGLKQVELEPGPITGLIGPQASGKSIVAKLLYFFREIASRLPAAVIADSLSPEEYRAECSERFFRYFPVETRDTQTSIEARGFFSSAEPTPAADARRVDALRSALGSILSAELVREKKQDLLEFADGRRVKLAQASSGQQEALPLLLFLARFLLLAHSRGRAVYIEEPEAHLFPSTQKLIVELMARAFRRRKDEMRLTITTHSPYILTSMNNLLQAGKIYAAAPGAARRRLAQVVRPTDILRPGEVAFFALENGGAKPILDPETGLIDASAIDQVSNDIAIQFDKLLAEGQ